MRQSFLNVLHKLWWQETQMFDVYTNYGCKKHTCLMFAKIMVTRNTNVWCLHTFWLQETKMFDVYTNYGYKKHKCLMLHKLWLQETQMFDVYTQYGYKKHKCLMFTQIMVTRNTNVWCLCVKKQTK